MQIDLFESRRKCEEMSKVGGYVKARKFKLDPSTDFNKIREMSNCTNAAVVNEYIDDVKKRIKFGRHYEDIGYDLGSDNLFDIEALGVGMYAKRYQIIIDFEDKLDYFLHSISRCSRKSVRNIPHYSEISSALTALKKPANDSELKLKLLYNIDDKLDAYLAECEYSLRNKKQYYGDALVEKLAYELEIAILREIAGVQNYIISYISAAKSENNNIVCRSRSYSALVLTSNQPMCEDLVLTQKDHEDLVIVPRCYEKYEYAAKEVLVCDYCRRC